MAIPPFFIPSSIRRYLAVSQDPDPAGMAIEGIRKGISRYSSVDPEVSIVIPAYNEGINILPTLASLASLSLPDRFSTEILVIDDGSTDDTREWLERLNVPHISLPENLSIKGARQEGLKACKGKIVLQADADSVYPPGWGIRYVEVLTSQSSVALAYGGHAFLPDPRTTRFALAIHEALGNVARKIRRKHREFINVHGFNSAFRREEALLHGSYEHDSLGSEDGEMARRLGEVGDLVYCGTRACRAWTSPRRLLATGGLLEGSIRRIKKEVRRLSEYLTGNKNGTA